MLVFRERENGVPCEKKLTSLSKGENLQQQSETKYGIDTGISTWMIMVGEESCLSYTAPATKQRCWEIYQTWNSGQKKMLPYWMKNKEQRSETLKEGITTEEGTDGQAWVRLKVEFRCF